MRLWTPGWNGVVQQTGSKPEYGPNVCEFAPLGAGNYSIALEDVEAGQAALPAEAVETEVSVGANRVVWARLIGGDPQQPPKPVEPEPPQPPPVQTRSVISGNVKNGDGLLVLLTGPGTEKHIEVASGRYRFAGLAAGVYRVAILAADPALGEVAARANLTVDGANAVTADFDLTEPPPVATGRIAGRVKGGAGRRITLAGPDGLTLTATVAADETYAFDNLPAGLYQATVSDSDPPTGPRATQGGIKVEATGAVQVDFDLDALKPGKTMEHYLLVGGPVRSKDDFLAVLQYVARFDPVVGSDEAEARNARHVTILGGVSAVSALVEQGLRMSGCQVRRIEGDYAASLRKLMDAGRPF